MMDDKQSTTPQINNPTQPQPDPVAPTNPQPPETVIQNPAPPTQQPETFTTTQQVSAQTPQDNSVAQPQPATLNTTQTDTPQPSAPTTTPANSTEQSEPSESSEDRPSFFRTFLSIIEFFGTVALLVFIILSFGLQSFHVVGTSMTPTLQEGDRLLISKLGRTWGKITNDPYVPNRGDIIVFKSPTDGIELVKRVIGLPGERVVLESGKFTVFNEDNPKGFNPDDVFPEGKNLAYTAGNVNVVIPEGEIFVSGDNRVPGGSLDSRSSLGTVPVDNIDGRLILRVLPITEARTF